MQPKAFVTFCILLALSGTTLFAQSTRRNPTSKFYVADVQGFSQVNTGERIEDLTEKSVFDAEGTIIETKPDSTNAIVLSNGVGLNFMEDTKLVVRRFLQEPFQPNRLDLETEPSVSQTRAQLVRGSLGICSGKLIAGSSMVYETPHGTVSLLSQNTQKAAIEVGEDHTTVTLFEGAITLRGDNMAGGESLQPGQQAVIRPRGANQPPEITIGPIPSDQAQRLEDMVNGACQARRKVYFDITERENPLDPNAPSLNAIPLTPLNPAEVGPIVSPARP